MSPSPPPPASAARRLRGASAAAVATTVLLLGALAGVVSTGVRLGTTLAPSAEDDPPPTTGGGERAGRTGAETSTTSSGAAGSLPDRVVGDRPPAGTAPPPGTGGGGPSTAPSAPGADPAPQGPYPAVWPYASWEEVDDHLRRGERTFASAPGTALRFAREVVGTAAPTAAVRGSGPTRATVAVTAAGGGTTLVHLIRAGPGGAADGVPWGVVGADGALDLSSPATADGPSIPVTVAGDGTRTVAVFDRRTWRGVAGAVEGGSAVVRVTPGAAGSAVVLALEGDPRRPASFTARRVVLAPGAGAAPVPAPSDPLAAVTTLLDAVAAGDVPAVWELLDGPARESVLDWRGLAGRLTGLRRALAPFSDGPLVTTSVATPAGSIVLVAPRVAGDRLLDAGPGALALRVDGGAARLSSLVAAEATWARAPQGGLLVTGPSRATAVVVDGTVVATEPEGPSLRVPLDGLEPGPHLAVAAFTSGGQVTTSTHLFVVDEPTVEPPPEPPRPPATTPSG